MKKVSQKFKDHPLTPLDTAVYWVEYIHRHGKDALRSPIIDMPWWQASLVDIYGFITLSIGFILYVIVKIFKTLTIFVQLQMGENLKLKRN